MAMKTDIEQFDIHAYTGDGFTKASVDIVKEIPLEILLNGHRVVTIACNGNHREELAVGYLRSEGFIRTKADLVKVEVSDRRSAVSVSTKDDIRIPLNDEYDGRTIASSGARGREREDMDNLPESLWGSHIYISPEAVFSLVASLIDSSHLHSITGGTHSSALASGENIIVLREDIGRHNTIDMLGGYALINDMDCSDKIIVRTGRVSLEIVNKVWNLGVPIIISLSVPTSTAVHASMEAGITLIGSVRTGKMKVYSHEWRVSL